MEIILQMIRHTSVMLTELLKLMKRNEKKLMSRLKLKILLTWYIFLIFVLSLPFTPTIYLSIWLAVYISVFIYYILAFLPTVWFIVLYLFLMKNVGIMMMSLIIYDITKESDITINRISLLEQSLCFLKEKNVLNILFFTLCWI